MRVELCRRVCSSIGLRLALCALLTATILPVEACHRLAAPAQLSVSGKVAFHADRVTKGIAELQDVVIRGEAAGVIPRNDARTVIAATELAGRANLTLADALRAGQSATTAREAAMATIRQALTDLPAQLSPDVRATVAPYIQVVLTALTLIG